MFSQASVWSQGVGEVTLNALWDRSHGRYILTSPGHQTWDLLSTPTPVLTSGGQPETCSNFFTCRHSPRATSGGGHWSTYGLQAGGTHATGMLSCKYYLLTVKNGRVQETIPNDFKWFKCSLKQSSSDDFYALTRLVYCILHSKNNEIAGLPINTD